MTTVFEILYRATRQSLEPETTGLTGHMAYICLAPFLGASAASELVERQLGGH